MTDRLTEAKQVLENYRLAQVEPLPPEVLDALAWAIGEIELREKEREVLKQQIRHLRKETP